MLPKNTPAYAGESFTCPVCGIKNRTQGWLNWHIKTKHKDYSPAPEPEADRDLDNPPGISNNPPAQFVLREGKWKPSMDYNSWFYTKFLMEHKELNLKDAKKLFLELYG